MPQIVTLNPKNKMGGQKAGPQKTGPGSQRFPRILRNLWGSAGRFCRTFCIAKKPVEDRFLQNPKGSAELWEPNPVFQALHILLPQETSGFHDKPGNNSLSRSSKLRKAQSAGQKVCSSKRPPKLEPRSV